MKHEGDGDSNCVLCIWNDPKTVKKKTREIGNQEENRNQPDNWIVEIGKNTEKSHGDLRRLVVTQTPVKDHQLKLVGKLNNNNNNNNNAVTDESVKLLISESSKMSQKIRE